MAASRTDLAQKPNDFRGCGRVDGSSGKNPHDALSDHLHFFEREASKRPEWRKFRGFAAPKASDIRPKASGQRPAPRRLSARIRRTCSTSLSSACIASVGSRSRIPKKPRKLPLCPWRISPSLEGSVAPLNEGWHLRDVPIPHPKLSHAVKLEIAVGVRAGAFVIRCMDRREAIRDPAEDRVSLA